MEILNHSIYPAIFSRRSTRNYSGIPVPADLLDRLGAFMANVVPLFPTEQAAFEIQPHKGNTMKIAAYAKSGAASFMNLAFMLQQMDLFIQENGMGAVWNATVRASKKQYHGLSYVICLVFGMAKGSSMRTKSDQFNRKQVQEISNRPELSWVEAVRLAPSARNRQPWQLVCGERTVDFYCKEGSFLGNLLLKDLHWLDIGIAVCHAVLSLQQEGDRPVAAVRHDAPYQEGYIYGVSLNYQ